MDIRQAQKIARIKNYRLSNEAGDILSRVEERHGQCPCRIDGTKCPCKFLTSDVREHGACHCGLFLEK